MLECSPKMSKTHWEWYGQVMIAIELRFLAYMCLGVVHSPNYVIFAQKLLVFGFISEISFRLEVWVLECSPKG